MSTRYLLFFLIAIWSLPACTKNREKVDSPAESSALGEETAPASVTHRGDLDRKPEVRILFVPHMGANSPQPAINRRDEIFAEVLKESGKTVRFVMQRNIPDIWALMDGAEDPPHFVYLPFTNFSSYFAGSPSREGSRRYVIVAGSTVRSSEARGVRVIGREMDDLRALVGGKVGYANMLYEQEYQLHLALESAGLSQEDIAKVEMISDAELSMPDLVERFAKGEFDAILVYGGRNLERALRLPESREVASLLPSSEQTGGPVTFNVLLARRDVIETHPEVAHQALRAHILSTDRAIESLDSLGELQAQALQEYLGDRRPLDGDELANRLARQWLEKEVVPAIDPNFAHIGRTLTFLQNRGLAQGAAIADFARPDLLDEVLEVMGRSPLLE